MTDKSYKFGIIGYPLGHSLSSVMHEAALNSLGLTGVYLPMETKPEDLVDRIKMLKRDNFDGFNVTIPHKVPVSLFLSKVDEYANLAGSVNTVKIHEDKSLEGFNTDVFGFIKAIPDDIKLEGESAAILGTGGAARAVVVGLASLKVKKINLYTRNIVDSHETAEALRKKFPEIEFNLIQNELLSSLEEFKILVNTTPLGMKGFRSGLCLLNEEIVDTMSENGLIYDLIYNPLETPLIKAAKKSKKRCIGGIDMLVYQGARAFEIWTGQKPDVKVMHDAILTKLLHK